MIGPIQIVAVAMLIAAAPVLAAQGGGAQGGGAPPAPRSTQPPKVLGKTGTMYDGNNARLRLPPEQNAWYENAWAGYQPNQAAISAAPASATGAGAAGTALGTTQTGGEH